MLNHPVVNRLRGIRPVHLVGIRELAPTCRVPPGRFPELGPDPPGWKPAEPFCRDPLGENSPEPGERVPLIDGLRPADEPPTEGPPRLLPLIPPVPPRLPPPPPPRGPCGEDSLSKAVTRATLTSPVKMKRIMETFFDQKIDC